MTGIARNRFTFFLTVLLVATSAAVAETAPEAQEWLERAAAIREKGPFQASYTGKMQGQQMGQMMTAKISGTILQAGPARMRVDADVEVGGMGAEGTMKMHMLIVGDGETLWVEATNPMLGGTQVLKVPADQMGKLGQMDPRMMDPLSQVEEMAKLFDFAIADENDKTVTLRADVDEPLMGGAEAPGSIQIVLDKTSAFPLELLVGEGEPTMFMRFSDVEFPASPSADAFAYSPPEGAPVVDMGAQAGSADSPGGN